MKKLALLLLCALAIAVFAGCGGGKSNGPESPNKVTMNAATFDKDSITINKGEAITFISAQGAALHILVIGKNGSFENEAGAPDFGGAAGSRVDVGDIWTSPPWNTAGTYHVTCTVHPAMNLTVIVIG
jgi:plastocyanin